MNYLLTTEEDFTGASGATKVVVEGLGAFAIGFAFMRDKPS
jgi:hypothetical protein